MTFRYVYVLVRTVLKHVCFIHEDLHLVLVVYVAEQRSVRND